jgi:ADP-ribosyl-[dinitrogen reductase] hydrolase
MIGAIIGDIAGSTYEFSNCKETDIDLFPTGSTFTDDSILTIATADVLLSGGDYQTVYRRVARMHPDPKGGYGAGFRNWISSDAREPYNSYGNGAAMRVSPVGFACDSLDAVLAEAERSATVTRNHPEGIRGAQATAVAVFMGRTDSSKEEIRSYISSHFGYDLDRTVDAIRPAYRFNESCQGTVPEAIVAFLDSEDYESAIRLAISLGGDADTLACIAGAIAQAFYRHIPATFVDIARRLLPPSLLQITDEFTTRFLPDSNAAEPSAAANSSMRLSLITEQFGTILP